MKPRRKGMLTVYSVKDNKYTCDLLKSNSFKAARRFFRKLNVNNEYTAQYVTNRYSKQTNRMCWFTYNL